MKKNIEVLKEMREKAFKFDILAEELIEMNELEECEPEELVINEQELVTEMLYEAYDILNCVKSLSFGGKTILNTEEFDADGLEYVIECIKHRITDLFNYIDTLQETIMQARSNAEHLIDVYNILCELSYTVDDNMGGGNTQT